MSRQETSSRWSDAIKNSHLVFAPGFEAETLPNYHSYTFIWWLEGRPEISAERLQADLLTYYRGISEERGRTRKFTPDLNRVSVTWVPSHPRRTEDKKAGVESFHGDATFYNPAGELLTLHSEASLRFCAEANHTLGVFVLSPHASGAPIWKDLQAIWDSVHCSH